MITEKIHAIEGNAKYIQVRNILYEMILKSDIQPGSKLWTESSLVSSLGVSITTVRKAIDELVRLGVVERRVGSGTYLKSLPGAATSNRSGSVSMLGFLTWNQMLRDPYYGQIMHGLDSSLYDAGLLFQVSSRQWGNDASRDLKDLEEQNPGAVIFPFSNINRKPFIFKLQALGIPLLLLSHGFAGYQGPVVGFDHRLGGRLAAEHFLERGHRRFAILAGPEYSPRNIDAVNSFCNTLVDAGYEVPQEAILWGEYSEVSGYAQTSNLLKLKDPPTAIFCCGDFIAYGAIKCLEEHGRSVPGDVAVIGSGNFQVSNFYYPRLTTLHMDGQQLGSLAGQWARYALGREASHWDPDNPVHMLPVHLEQGSTT